MRDFLFVQNFVDNKFRSGLEINHENIAVEFQELLRTFSDEEFADILIFTGFIPDMYDHDSSEETLYTKMIEVIVTEWANRLGFKANYLKEKSSKEDINITIGDKVIVADAKSFRLGRSQKAPNTKDFIKLEDIKKWMTPYKNAIGGLVCYPCRHEWSKDSDAYLYCSTKETPTVMLPYKYLSYILKAKENFDTNDLIKLWEYDRIFPEKLSKKSITGNKVHYWSKINDEIIAITNTSKEQFQEFMGKAEEIITECVIVNLKQLNDKIEEIKNRVIKEIETEDINTIRENYKSFKIDKETEEFVRIMRNINNFRFN